MKKLQNNFTTPEQAKRLLELGVPADSADCYFYDWDIDYNPISHGGCPQIFDWFEKNITCFKNRRHVDMYPCWSVGQLIYVLFVCFTDTYEVTDDALEKGIINDLITVIEDYVVRQKMGGNFSKLEE